MPAFPRVGLAAVLEFMSGAAVRGMQQASTAFGGMSREAGGARAAVAQLKGGLTGLAIAGGAVAAAGGLVVRKYAQFSAQMATVQAVLGESERESFPALEAQAKSLGATTVFTATQAAAAMENLARAGFAPQEILQATGSVLAAAAAEGMDLATAAEIVSANIKSFGLEAKDAARVSDTLAFVSARTASGIVDLQEGLKFAAPVAKSLGINLEDTAAALGILGDVGIKGTLAGTALKSALLDIAEQAKGGSIGVGKLTAKIVQNEDGSLRLADTFQNLVAVLAKIEDPLKRTQAGMKLFGLRGMPVQAAFDALGGPGGAEKVAMLFGGLGKAAEGSAAEMARMRLDSLAGDFELLSSAVDGVVNELGAALAPAVRTVSRGVADRMAEVAAAFSFFSTQPKAIDETGVAIAGVSRTTMELVQGVLQGLGALRSGFEGVTVAVAGVARWFGFASGEGPRATAKLATEVLGVAAALGPLAIGLKGAKMLFGGLASTGIGTARLLAAALGGVAKSAGGILGKFPRLAKVLPGAAGKLAGAVGALDTAAAQPVRVVNFGDMLGGGGIGAELVGAATGAGGLPAVGPGGGRVGGVLGRAVGAAGGALGRVPGLGAAGAGLRLAGAGGGVRDVMWAAKAAGGGLLAQVATVAGPLAAAGAAGFAIGTAFDRLTGASDKLSSAFVAGERAAAAERVAKFGNQIAVANATKMSNQLAALAARGVGQFEAAPGKKVALTREAATSQVQAFLAKQALTQQQMADALKVVEGTLARIPTADKLQVSVQVDGKQIAVADAKKRAENKQRLGKPRQPGEARRAGHGGT